MSEATLLLFGCAMSFMTAAGTYMFYRNQFSTVAIEPKTQTLQTEATPMALHADRDLFGGVAPVAIQPVTSAARSVNPGRAIFMVSD